MLRSVLLWLAGERNPHSVIGDFGITLGIFLCIFPSSRVAQLLPLARDFLSLFSVVVVVVVVAGGFWFLVGGDWSKVVFQYTNYGRACRMEDMT